MKYSENKPAKRLVTDVLVIGGGAAGLIAAARAAESGAKVTVVEKMARFGGSGKMAMGICGIDTPLHRRLGLNDDPDEFYQQHMERQAWECNAMLVRGWTLESHDTFQWLENIGVKFNMINPLPIFPVEMRRNVLYTEGLVNTGKDIVTASEKYCRELGVELIANAPAKKLLQGKDGSIVGAIAEQEDCLLEVQANAVLLASGNISGNLDLVKRALWDRSDLESMKIIQKMPGTAGDGWYMAQEVGAKEGYYGLFLIGPHNHPNNMHTGLIQRRPQLIWLNKNGERFCDETMYALHQYSWFSSNAINLQPGSICYPMFDQAMLDDFSTNKRNIWAIEMMQGKVKANTLVEDSDDGSYTQFESTTEWLDHIIEDIESEVATGRILKANTLKEVADWIGADEATVKKTICDYNRACELGYDSEFLRREDMLIPLEKPPYYVMKGLSGIDSVNGGIEIDHRFRVLNHDRKPIPNLFAAGVCASGITVRGYGFPGTCLGSSVYMGYASGRELSDHVHKKRRGE